MGRTGFDTHYALDLTARYHERMDTQASSQAPSLPQDQYHQIVSPALQVAAELAAVRGDPELYNDMASMLALRTLVQRFGDFYLDKHPESDDELRTAIAGAPKGACVMALQRAELDEKQMRECLWALDTASDQLTEAGVIGCEKEHAMAAWRQLGGGNRKHALDKLKLAAGVLVTAIDQWERERDLQRETAPS